MTGFAERLYRASAGLSLAAAWVSIAIVAAMTVLILAEIVLRSFFGWSTGIVEEYVGYGLMTMIFLGLGHALERGNLIRVDLVLDRLPATARRVVEIALTLLALAVLWFVGHYLWISMVRRYEMGTVSMTTAATPLWIPEAIVVAGVGIFALQLLAYAMRLLAGGPLIDDRTSFD